MGQLNYFVYFGQQHNDEQERYLSFSKHGLVVSGQNKVYMAGGEYPDGSASKAVWRYDPTLDVWQEVESMQNVLMSKETRIEQGKVFFSIFGKFACGQRKGKGQVC